MSDKPWLVYTSTEAICELHARGLEAHGGAQTTVPPRSCIERSLGAAWSAEKYVGDEDGIPGLCFAGCLLFYLLMNHCFLDGNKRISWNACAQVLRQLGLTVNATDDEAEQLLIDIMCNRILQATDVVFWLAPRLVALS